MTTAARDGCVVESLPLAGVLLPFIDKWDRAYGDSATPNALTATGFLADKTGLSKRTIENITKRNRDTGKPTPQTRTTELRIADPLIAAIGRTEVFFDGTLTIQPNMLAHPSARAACCSTYA